MARVAAADEPPWAWKPSVVTPLVRPMPSEKADLHAGTRRHAHLDQVHHGGHALLGVGAACVSKRPPDREDGATRGGREHRALGYAHTPRQGRPPDVATSPCVLSMRSVQASQCGAVRCALGAPLGALRLTPTRETGRSAGALEWAGQDSNLGPTDYEWRGKACGSARQASLSCAEFRPGEPDGARSGHGWDTCHPRSTPVSELGEAWRYITEGVGQKVHVLGSELNLSKLARVEDDWVWTNLVRLSRIIDAAING